jgi:hypothetical protein
VDIEVYNPSGSKVFQQFYDNQTFSAGQQRSYSSSWSVPTTAAQGTYTVKIGVFRVGWDTLYSWNNNAAQFVVQ